MSGLKALWETRGQAIWFDYIQRSLLTGGGLQRLVEEDGVRGVTSNPSIFEKAIAGSEDYDAATVALLEQRPELTTGELYEALVIADIQSAADILHPVYETSGGSDGYVSLEVSPHLANSTGTTVEEARRLWRQVDRANLMIKVPATPAGIPAIETLIGDGINVNATLMFSLEHYEAVANAYLRGLARAAAPERIASVASFFVSRVDSQVDRQLQEIGTPAALALCGTAAIANCKVTFRRFLELFGDDGDFAALRRRGARVQRPLWASTSTKNPAYSPVLYVAELIGPDTVNTVPAATLDAFRDHVAAHGLPGATLTEGGAEAAQMLSEIATLGIDLDAITTQLQVDGVTAFANAFDKLLTALDQKRVSCLEDR